jgi:F0F1-type ATP synthase assembly protein I
MIHLGPAREAPFRAPASGHRDHRWYRSAATKTSTATPEALPEGRETDDVAWVAVSHLVAGILLYSGLGWLVGNWLGNQAICVAVGTLVGTAFALYLVFARLGATRTGPETPRQDDDDRLAPTPHGGRRTDAHDRGSRPWLT